MMRDLARLLACLLPSLAVSTLHADDAHYQNFVAGARGTTLGGAFTAIADDSSGLYFNPAGIVDVRRANLSISSSLYGFERQLSFAGELDGQRWIDEFTRRPITGAEVNIIPAATGVAWAFGRQLPDGSFPHGVALGAIVPSYRGSVHQSHDLQHSLDLSTSSRISDRTILASAGYAYRVGPWLRLGAALQTSLRLIDMVEEFTLLDISTLDTAPAYLTSTSDLSLTNASLAVILGAKFHPSRRWLIGLALTSPSLSVFQRGSFGVRSARANYVSTTGGVPETNLGAVQSRVRYEGSLMPLTARLGLAYVKANDFTLTLDLSLYAPTRYELVGDACNVDIVGEFTPLCQVALLGQDTFTPLPANIRRQSPIPVEVDRQWTGNVNLGVEKLLRGDISLGVGLFTDLSSAPDYAVDDKGYLTNASTRVSNVDHVGATLTAGYFGENSLSRLGLCTVFGWGQKARVVSPGARFFESTDPAVRPVDTQEFLIYVFWSSTFRYGEGRTRLSESEQ
ncbi:MAG: hypothetical protein ABIJ09_10275 [Pseudomonadota bacterium]